MSLPFSLRTDHARLSVRLTPGGGRNAIEGCETASDGDCVLKARVTAVAEGGKANKALIAMLAKALHHPKTSISIISGDTARKKILRIDGDPEDLSKRLTALFGV